MTEVQTQPDHRMPCDVSEKDALITQLDHLLERYLNTLDQYQKAQQQLTANMSSGYLSLAQANFNNTSGARYGQDYYDERMQASRRITLVVEETNVGFRVYAPDLVPGAAEKADAQRELSEKPSGVSATSTAADPTDANNASSGATKKSTSPLRWFGILVPPALKAAQATFTSAIEGPVPQLASLVKDLRTQEIDIARLRKQIKKLDPKT